MSLPNRIFTFTLLFGIVFSYLGIALYSSVADDYASVKGIASPTASYSWTKAWVTETGGNYAWAEYASSDSQGNVYVSGSLEAVTETDLDPGPGVIPFTSNTNERSNFLYKFDQTGALQWVRLASQANVDNFMVDVDANDNPTLVFRCSAVNATFDFDFTEGTDTKTCHGFGVVKFSSVGAYLGGYSLDNEITQYVGVLDFDHDQLNNLYVAGYHFGTVDLAYGGGSDLSVSSSGAVSFLWKVNADGSYGGSYKYANNNPSGSAYVYEVETDANNNVYLSGNFNGNVDFDPSGSSYEINATGFLGFVTKLNANGSFAWAKQFGGPVNGVSHGGMAVQKNTGDIYIGGDFNAEQRFDYPSGPLINTTNVGGEDGFVVKFSTSGAFQWVKTYDTTGWLGATDLAVSNNGDVYGTGYMGGVVDFDPNGTYALTVDSVWDCNMYVFAFDSTGSFLWAATTAGGNETDGYALALTDGGVYVAGDVYDTANFNPTGIADMVFGDPDNGAATLTKYMLTAPPTMTNVALSKTATGSTPCAGGESYPQAIDGNVATKWCSLVSQPLWLQVDLGNVYDVRSFVLKHSGAGGEPEAYNSKDFSIEVSTDASNWSTVVTVTNNTSSVTTHQIASTSARYIKVNVTAPQADGGAVARIFELEVYSPGLVATPSPSPSPSASPVPSISPSALIPSVSPTPSPSPSSSTVPSASPTPQTTGQSVNLQVTPTVSSVPPLDIVVADTIMVTATPTLSATPTDGAVQPSTTNSITGIILVLAASAVTVGVIAFFMKRN